MLIKNLTMPSVKNDIITQLKREILPLQGLRSPRPGSATDLGLGFMGDAFPDGHFPLGAVHELISEGAEALASTSGFICGLLSGLMKSGGIAIWIGSSRILFPPALKAFGVRPDQIIFVDLQRDRDVRWAMEESLKCDGLAAVVGEISELGFTDSRRFQLVVEQSRVTGFILRSNPKNLNTTASVSRWKIKPLPTFAEDDLPGPGFPCWQVELLKIRNGKPGSWQVEWAAGRFRLIPGIISSIILDSNRKTG
jgi:protein ImuA